MTRKSYTKEDTILCAYIALYETGLLTEKKIANFGGRSVGSVHMKVQNIAAMLDDKNIARNLTVSPLTGLPAGESGRETDWSIVLDMTEAGKEKHWSVCKDILTR